MKPTLTCVLSLKDTNRLLTGPHAHDIVEQHNSSAENISLKRWRIFVSEDDENVRLDKDTRIIYSVASWNFKKLY